MKNIRNFNEYPFLRENKSKSFQKQKIYKYCPSSQIFFLVTPTFLKTPKVLSLDEVNTLILKGKFTQYKKSSNIYEKINIAWENWSDEWTYNGELFFADSKTDLRDAPWHHEFGIPYKIGYYHGNLVWVSGFQYSPRVCFTRFESIIKKPDWSKLGYTSMRNIKPVYSNKKQCYI